LYTLVQARKTKVACIPDNHWRQCTACRWGDYACHLGFSAVEGLRYFNDQIDTVPIVIAIITALFIIQQFGTRFVGKFFGPVMLIWFMMIGGLGFISILYHPEVLKSVNPYYAYKLLLFHKGGFWLLGAIFLCTTGAEGLYSDLGHCGKKNIRVSWSFVKVLLLLNYFGQGAWLISEEGKFLDDKNPFTPSCPTPSAGWD
jgi:KUP system potassium uptake protein